ncbi:hypothetical protein [Derxia gummosa]|uniref:Uncharacterized protein n=1 Tax=Derxia gummosa DSM 723 TaxID=1121388 RepID=A0A8B6XCS6_9BURK|nr:hypothetical protein [Derxia gummosa]
MIYPRHDRVRGALVGGGNRCGSIVADPVAAVIGGAALTASDFGLFA